MTCKQGERHRWDESRSHCLDCGRGAAACADELHDWLVQKEDLIDHWGDQREAMRAQMEDWLEATGPDASVHRYDQGRTYCGLCGGCIAALPHAARPAVVTGHQENCPISRTSALLAELEAEDEQ
jgi:ferredoxin